MRSLLIVFCSILVISLFGQDTEKSSLTDGWAGRFAIEVGQEFQFGSAGETGVSFLANNGYTGITLQFSGAYFATDNLAITGGFGVAAGE